MIIGIDPGTNNGMAFYSGGELKRLCTFSTLELICFLTVKFAYIECVVIEDSRMQSFLFTGSTHNRAQALKIARNVGQVDMICCLIESICAKEKIELISISPKEKGKKIDKYAFNKMTGWDKKSNQHERDAACVAYQFKSR